MSTMTAILPSELDLMTIPSRKIGELLVNSSTASLYMVVENEDTGEKEAKLIVGEAYYKLLQYLKYNNLIQPTEPERPEYADTWFNTDLVYTEPLENKKSAYISIKVLDDTMPSGFKWLKILPITEAKNVYLGGRNKQGEPLTLENLLSEDKRRFTVVPGNVHFSKLLKDGSGEDKAWYKKNLQALSNIPQVGELYTHESNGRFQLWLKYGERDVDRKLLADTMDSEVRAMITETIRIGEKPLNGHEHSIWYSYNNQTPTDEALENARTLFMNVMKEKHYELGLKFTRGEGNTDGIRIYGHNKGVKFINNLITGNHTHAKFILNEGFPKETLSYFELVVDEDTTNTVGMVFLSKDFNVPSTGDTFGKNSESLLIDSNRYLYNNLETRISDPNWDGFLGKTIFFLVNKAGKTDFAEIAFGYVLDDGSLQFIVGDADVNSRNGWIPFNNLDTFGVTARYSTESTAEANIYIDRIKTTFKPMKATALNNELPGESAWQNVVVATNAKSLYLDNSRKLSDLMVGGRLITTIRTHEGTNNGLETRAGELTYQRDANGGITLRLSTEDGHSIPIEGMWEQYLEGHLLNSVDYGTHLVSDIRINETDLSRVYYTDEWEENTKEFRYVVGNPTIYVKSATLSLGPDGTPVKGRGYRMLLPRTKSELVEHEFVDRDGVTKKLKLSDKGLGYLDKEFARVNRLYDSKMNFHNLEDLGVSPSTLLMEGFTGNHFITKLSSVMPENSYFTNTIQKSDTPDNKKTDITRLFGINEEGLIEVTKGRGLNPPLFITVKNPDGTNKVAVSKYNTGTNRYETGPFRILADKEVTADGKLRLEIDELLVRDKAEIKNLKAGDAEVKHVNVVGGPNSGLTAKDDNIDPVDPFNLITYKGSKTGPDDDTQIIAGDEEIKNFVIKSKSKPTWFNKKVGKYEDFLTLGDVGDWFKYRGPLDKGTNSDDPRDLNDLHRYSDTGYYSYVYPDNYNLTNKGFPDLTGYKAGRFILKVWNSKGADVTQNDTVFQELTYYDMNVDNEPIIKKAVWTRVSKNDGTAVTWMPWVRDVNNDDMSKKADLSGATFTGPVHIEGDNLLSANKTKFGEIELGTKLTLKDKGDIVTSPNDDTINIGNVDKTVNILTNGVAKMNGEDIALANSVNALRDTLTGDIYTKNDIDSKLAEKTNLTDFNEFKEDAVSRTKDSEVKATVTFIDNSNLNVNSTLDVSEGKIKIPIKNITNEDDVIGVGSQGLQYGTKSNKEGVLTIQMDPLDIANEVNDVSPTHSTGIQIKSLKDPRGSNKSKHQIRSIYGGVTGGDWSTIMTLDQMSSDFKLQHSYANNPAVFDDLNEKVLDGLSVVRSINANHESYSGYLNALLPDRANSVKNAVNASRELKILQPGRYSADASDLRDYDPNNNLNNDANVHVYAMPWDMDNIKNYQRVLESGLTYGGLNVRSNSNKRLIFALGENRLAFTDTVVRNDKITWNYLMDSSNTYDKDSIDRLIQRLTDTVENGTRSNVFNDYDGLRSMGMDFQMLSTYVDPIYNKQTIHVESEAYPTFRQGGMNIVIKGISTDAHPIHIIIGVNKTNGKYRTYSANQVPGSKWRIINLKVENNKVKFDLVNVDKADTQYTGLTINVQHFGTDLSRVEVPYTISYIADDGAVTTPTPDNRP